MCARRPGLEPKCADDTLEVSDHNVVLNMPIALKPRRGVIYGRASREAVVGIGTAETGEVSIFDGAGTLLAGPVPTNAAGYYILPNLKPGVNLKLRVTYQGATASRKLSLTHMDLQGKVPFNIVMKTGGPNAKHRQPLLP